MGSRRSEEADRPARPRIQKIGDLVVRRGPCRSATRKSVSRGQRKVRVDCDLVHDGDFSKEFKKYRPAASRRVQKKAASGGRSRLELCFPPRNCFTARDVVREQKWGGEARIEPVSRTSRFDIERAERIIEL